MAIPNPNPNIADGIKSDNGKVLSVNSDEDGYILRDVCEETTGTVTAGTDIVFTSSNLKKVACITQLSIAVSDSTTATLARWGNVTIGTVDIKPKYEISGLTKIRLGATDWFDVNYSIDTDGNIKISDIYGVTAGTITGLYLTVLYIS